MCHWSVLFLRIFVDRQVYTFLAVDVDVVISEERCCLLQCHCFPDAKEFSMPLVYCFRHRKCMFWDFGYHGTCVFLERDILARGSLKFSRALLTFSFVWLVFELFLYLLPHSWSNHNIKLAPC